MRRLAALAVLAAMAASACSHGAQPPATGRVTPLGGQVEVGNGRSWSLVDGATDLRSGSLLRTQEEGRARLDLGDGASIELAPMTVVGLVAPDRTSLESGSILAQGNGLEVSVEDLAIRPSGRSSMFRVDRALSTRVGVYGGGVQIASRASPVAVPPFEQAIAIAGAVPERPGPLTVSPTDPWDVRLLGQAIEVGLRLARLERGLGVQVRGLGGPAGLIAQSLRRFSIDRVRTYLARHAAGEVFLALGMAAWSARGLDLPPATLAREILALRAAGASWILVVARYGLVSPDLLAVLGRLLASIPGLFAPIPAIGGGGAGGPAGPGGGGGGTPPGGSTGGTTPPPGGSPGQPGCASGDLACSAGQAVDDLIGTVGDTLDLLGLPPPPPLLP